MDTVTLDDIADKFVELYKSNLLKDGKKASGNLINTAKAAVQWNGTVLSVTLQLPDYWEYAEYGRKPGKFPPVDAIKQWIRVKRILPRAGRNGKVPTENQLAFLIGRKIARQGIKGSRTLEKTMNEFQLMQKLLDELGRLMQEQIENDVDKML